MDPVTIAGLATTAVNLIADPIKDAIENSPSVRINKGVTDAIVQKAIEDAVHCLSGSDHETHGTSA
jgi:hypothetical protein